MINLKSYRQKEWGYCGPVVLKIVMDYYGVFVSEEELSKIAETHKKWGTSIEGMIKAAEHFGFRVFYKEDATINELHNFVVKNETPVIVRWFCQDTGHYSIIVDVTDKNIIMVDPSNKILIFVKKRVMSKKEFMRVWFDLAESELKVALPRQLIRQSILVLNPKKK